MNPKLAALLLYPKRSCPTPDGDYIAVKASELDEVEQQRDDMAEALIEEWKFIEKFLACYADSIDNVRYNDFLIRQHIIKKLIEKATGKTWDEIKGLKN